MNINIDDLNINYKLLGENNSNTIVILHGWGASIESFNPVSNYLSKNNKVYVIDLPGFGSSDEPKRDFFIVDYANIINKFLKQLNIENSTLIGHSFGGRVIMKLVGDLGYTPKNIILVDSAGIKPKRKIDYYFKVYSYKTVKMLIKLFNSKDKAEEIISELRKKAGSTDYKTASDIMKKVLINTVNEDLRYCLPNIKVPTLLIWGENDKDTPVKDAKIIEKLIPDSGLIVFKNAGHYSYLDKLNDFLVIVNNFLKEGK